MGCTSSRDTGEKPRERHDGPLRVGEAGYEEQQAPLQQATSSAGKPLG